jgi:PleD family two-component response regulator
MTEKLNSTMIKKTELENEIKKRIVIEKKLNILSTIDELTSLYNCRAFNDFKYINDEFIIILSNSSIEEASLGITEIFKCDEIDDVIRRVDRILYKDKEEGKKKINKE